jgi:outer membrane autotransporter protein
MDHRSSPLLRRLTAGLLLGTCLAPAVGLSATVVAFLLARPALADGGDGGGSPGSGGADSTTGSGSDGTNGAGVVGGIGRGGGGGGAGVIGGAGGTGGFGGTGGSLPGGGGGAGATTAGGNGGTGGGGVIAGGDGAGGGGGGGGAHGSVSPTLSNGGTLQGGSGGAGGAARMAGGGGGGGYGAVVTGSGSSANSGSLLGGAGGAGGTGFGFGNETAQGGSGGSGGVGLTFTGSGSFSNSSAAIVSGGTGGAGGSGLSSDTHGGNGGAGGAGIVGSGLAIANQGTISGGAGGSGGTGDTAGTAGAGGVGIMGSGLTVINGGSISGGAAGGGGPLANAIVFTGGTNLLELQTGSTITGNVVAFSAADTLRLGGSGSQTFDTSTLGPAGQFQNFGVFVKTGAGTWTLTNSPGQVTPWTINQGTLAITNGNNLGTAGETLTFNGGTLQLAPGFIGGLNRPIVLNAGGGTIDTGNQFLVISTSISGPGGLTKNGIGTLDLQVAATHTGGTTINAGTLVLDSVGGSLPVGGALTVNGGFFDMSEIATGQTVGALTGTIGVISLGANTLTTNSSANTMLATQIWGIGSLVKQGSGILTLAGNNFYSGGTTVSGGLINFAAANNLGTGAITLNGGGLQWATGNTLDISSRLAPLGAAGGTFDTNGNNVTLAATISGAGALTKQGLGTLTLSAGNTYSGGTVVTGGLINFNSANNFGPGMVTLNGGGLQWATGSTADISSKLMPLGAGGGILDTNGNNVTLATAITGSGGLAKQGLGTLNLTGTNTYTGGTAVFAGTLSVNGSVAGNVAVGSVGTLGGNGTIAGNVVNAGTLAPGNSIGLLTVSGSYTQMAGSTYQVEANAAGQADRINVGGTAAIQGGTVQVQAAAGSYANSTTYTILRATGGVSGTYAGVSSNFAFLTPTLSYDANDVFLTLALGQNAFTSFSGITPNQKAVGVALNQSFANAAGDFATVIGALAGLNTVQGPLALNTISGEPYADFGTMNTNNAAMFMNALGQQMANARGSSASTGQRQALAQACEIESCDGTGPLNAWASALGGLGSVLGDSNASTLTYNFGGAAAGLDYRFDPRFLAGIGVGYTHGTQWVNTFMGQGWSDSVSVAAYGSFTQSGFYLDALAGYAYFNNQLQRQIQIPGLQQRTATGSTGANQFLGQIEGGYKVDVYAPAAATVTPFGRFQISSVTQNAFSESGAQSLDLNVAQQTTNSQRTTIGADLGSSIGLGNERKLDLAVRLGWQHEFASTSRPITAAFAGAPGNSFTVFGATPARDAAVVGLQAMTNIADATQVYLRYDGGVGGGTDNHALMAGLRMSW